MRDVDDLLDEVYSGQERMTRDDIYRRAVAASLPAEVIVALTALPEGEYAQDEVSESLAQLGDVNAEHAEGVSVTDLSDDDLLRELAELHRTRNETLRHGSDQALDRHDERTTEMEAEYLRRFPEREVDPDRIREGARHRQAAVRPIEETLEVELAIGDEGPVPSLTSEAASQAGRASSPAFQEPAPAGGPGPRGVTAARTAGASPDTGAVRTGAEQPWDPEDLAVAEGHDPTPRNVENARQELAREGRSAIERTVP
ncbi:hypothetical protein Raf01_10210 [Rugosimonospora africana]|uniref:Uncharacterized protein n=1 Tax=Rugosimonospora africana TaxID=556532 RepID=A0A8J3VN52_9ACTN|nr:hypothetical protein Raf01_10210 [Rugosimonospora africana]